MVFAFAVAPSGRNVHAVADTRFTSTAGFAPACPMAIISRTIAPNIQTRNLVILPLTDPYSSSSDGAPPPESSTQSVQIPTCLPTPLHGSEELRVRNRTLSHRAPPLASLMHMVPTYRVTRLVH